MTIKRTDFIVPETLIERLELWHELCAATTAGNHTSIYKEALDRIRQVDDTMKKLREGLRGCFLGVFLDGHNEYGYHVLPMNEATIELNEIELLDYSEDIFKDAALFGYIEGDFVIIQCRLSNNEFEYATIDTVLTEIFYGTHEEQDKNKCNDDGVE